MLLIRKDKKKLAVHKGRVWDKEIKFEPVLPFGSYERVGNARIRLWKPLNDDHKNTTLKNDHKRKHQKQSTVSKTRGRAEISNTSKKVVPRRLITLNHQPRTIGKRSDVKLMGYSSTNKKVYKTINDTAEGENKLFKTHFSSDYYEESNIQTQFIRGSDTLKYVVDNLIVSEPTHDTIFPNNLIEYPKDNEGENIAFKSHFSPEYSKKNEEYTKNQFITLSEVMKNIPEELMKSDLNNISNSGNTFPNAVMEFQNNDEEENKLFESNSSSDNKNQNKEYASNQFLTKSKSLKNIPNLNEILHNECILPDVIEFPTDNVIIFPNTSQYIDSLSTAFISLENLILTSQSDEFYKNIRKHWTVDSSKVLMTPSKESINSGHSTTSIRCDLMNVDENDNTEESTHKDFIQLLDAIDGNLNDIIKDHQFPEQTILKLQEEGDGKLDDLRKDHQFLDQTTKRVQSGINSNLNDEQFSNSTYIKFIVLKKSRENQATILDSSEEIENNIFTRNKISQDFKNLMNNSVSGVCSTDKKLLVEENEIDDVFSLKMYSMADVLHDDLLKQYDAINFDTKVQLSKVSQEPNKPIYENGNFTFPKLMEDQTTMDSPNNETIQATDENIQNVCRRESKFEIPLENIEDEKNVVSPSVSINTGKNFKALSEGTNSLETSMSKVKTFYFGEPIKHDLELAPGGTSGKATGNDTKKTMGRNQNGSSSRNDAKNNFTMKSKEPKNINDELQYHLASKSNHNIIDIDSKYSEVTKRTNEIIYNIITAKTYEELQQLIKPKRKYTETENIEKNDIEEVLITNCLDSEKLVDDKEQKRLNNKHNTHDINYSGYKKNNMKKFEKEESHIDSILEAGLGYSNEHKEEKLILSVPMFRNKFQALMKA
ncbi:uncharacterized protein PF3D7_1120600 isoform X2 [Halyomorpha halys]|uniref:uncharacterized protein PF3D7_1120600 isoform X2 n=1 Tax=Halyomorpha halys TaxID=286706 RepID=UPI0006D4D0A9|nr:uncharacterized protein LOC106686077 isoform X2 [Halyomorpha halys]